MPRYMRFDENEDKTILITVDLGEGELTFLVPMDFDDLMGLVYASEAAKEFVEETEANLIYIPNEIE